ncbi:nuclear protein MDM1 isoform X2 [Betta splendens]|uniref:Nuclear protein MDM1 n=1 Tax=Betta splendens TaxID=158456 RepID=A0A6P7NGH5_BETSP|nr:nuclear protein MDM1 isoform X2 [Betta splendens]
MTVRFKSQSEYQRSFGVSRSRSLSPQRCGPLAGLRSDRFGKKNGVHPEGLQIQWLASGISREPGIQRRKRLGPGAVAQLGTSVSCPSGPQRSLSAHAQRKEPSAASRSCSVHRKEPSLEPKPSTPPQPRSTSEPKTPDGPRPAADPEPAGNPGPPAEQIAARKSVKLRSSHPDSHSITALPDGQQPSANKGEHALRWRSGSRSRRSGAQRSEYHRQFNWKKAVPAASPILTAEQVLYSTSRPVPPFKKNPIPLETEYLRSFQGLVPPTGPRLRKHMEHQRTPLFHMQKTHRRKKEESQKKHRPALDVTQTDSTRPQSPPPPAQRRHRIPEEGGAAGGEAPQVKELRDKAQSYRRRAWGTNFSRDHLNQLQSEHNTLWEPTDSSTEPASPHLTFDLCEEPDSLEALDLASRSGCSSKRSSLVGSAEILKQNRSTLSSPETKAQTEQSPAKRRTAWGEEKGNQEGEEDDTDDEEGRLPTPRLKMRPVQRTHHDLTTPATGGAIIVGKLNSDDFLSNQQTGGSPVSMVAKMDRAPDASIKQREVWSENSPTHLKVSGCSPNHKQASKAMRMKQTSPSPLARPSMLTSPLHCIQGTLRHPDFQHNGELGLRSRELQCSGGGCGSDEDDQLSVMSWRSAASCSVASAILERAQKRRENFWGKR